MKYPITKKISYKDKYNNNYVNDDYHWLKNIESKDVELWLNKQHAYTDKYFFDNKDFVKRKAQIESLDNEINILSLNYQHDQYIGVYDSPKDGLNVFLSNEDFKQMTILQSAKQPYTTIFAAEFSPTDPDLYIFTGYYKDETRISINLVSRKEKKVISRFGFGFDYHWSKNGKYIYYSKAITDDKDLSKSIQEISRYDVYSQKIEKVYTYNDNAVFVKFDQSNDDVIATIDINYHDTKLLLINDKGEVKELSDVNKTAYDYIGSIKERLYFIADEDGDKYQIVYFTIKDGFEKRVILDKPIAFEMAAKVVADEILVIEKNDAEDLVKIYDKDGRYLNDIYLPSEYASVRIIGEGQDCLFLNFESVSNPTAILKYAIESKKISIVKNLSISKIANNLTVEKHRVKLRDNKVSTVYVIYDKNNKPSKDSPLLMYGYGGYGASQSLGYRDPTSNYSIKAWCENGGVYANVILRGGSEYGRSWHNEGRLKNKQNTFNDLFDLTTYIHNLNISSPKKTVVGGISNGGLLVSAAYTQRPDLYACIIDSVGLNDMLHFIKDPRGSMYKTEYGDAFDADMFDYLKAYSPYHNLKTDVDYPAIYIHSGMLDTNVPPYHGMKFAAKAQSVNPSGKPILLRVLPNGHHDLGHKEEHYLTIAERQCFIEKTLDIAAITEQTLGGKL